MSKIKRIALFFVFMCLCTAINPIYSDEMPKTIYLNDGSTIETDGAWLPANFFNVDNTYIPYYKGDDVVIKVEVKDVDIEKTFGSEVYNEYLEKRHKRERSAALLKEYEEEKTKGDVYITDYRFGDIKISNFKVEKERIKNKYREMYEYYISFDITYDGLEPRKDGIYTTIKALSSTGLILHETSTGAVGPFFQGTSKNVSKKVRITNEEIFSRIDQWKITGVSEAYSEFRSLH